MDPNISKLYDALPDFIPVDLNNLQAIENTPLRQKALPLQFPLSDDDRKDIRTLTMKFQSEQDIAGLAAPQIGISKRIIMFNEPLYKDEPFSYKIWINPSYEKVNDEKIRRYEECFSVKDMTGPVKRYKRVRYKAFDTDGNILEGVVKGFIARLIQHEVDHLNGILYIDLVPKGKVITLHKHLNNINDYMNEGLPMIKSTKKNK